MEASVTINIAGIRQTFTTRNEHHHPELITIHLVDGPFSMLTGTWQFQALAEAASKVVYTMEYAFSSRTLEAVVAPIFNRHAHSFIDSFTQRPLATYRHWHRNHCRLRQGRRPLEQKRGGEEQRVAGP